MRAAPTFAGRGPLLFFERLSQYRFLRQQLATFIY
jgi:hypothetical protein